VSGSVPNRAFATVDFGGGGAFQKFQWQRARNGGHGPYVVTEWYVLWFTEWGGRRTGERDVSPDLDAMFALNASVNVYMEFGGTNFLPGPGYWITTSYDYFSPIAEDGDLRNNYYRMLAVAKKYFPNIPVLPVKNSTKKAFGDLKLTQGISLGDVLPIVTERSVSRATPVKYEEFEQAYGFVVYEATVAAGALDGVVRDRGTIVQNGRVVAVKQGGLNALPVAAGKVEILCEAIGRGHKGYLGPEYNTADGMLDWKGITNMAQGGKAVTGWTSQSVPLGSWKFKNIAWKSELPVHVPAFYRGTFNVDSPADTFLNPTGLTRGTAFLNGVHIGAYWTIGPQITLYIRAPQLKVGENEIVIFETGDIASVPTLKLEAAPIL
jgi:beta-galactosidase